MTKTELDTLAVMVKQSSEIALDHGLVTFAERFERKEADFDLRLAEVTQTMMDAVAETRDSAEGFLLAQVKEAVEEATRIGERIESIRSEMTDEVLASLHEFTEQRNLKFKDLDEKNAETGEATRKIAEEFALLHESAAAALLKISEFQKQVTAELSALTEKRLEETLQVLRLENVIIRDDVRTEVNELLTSTMNEVEKFLTDMELPAPIPGEPGEPGTPGEKGDQGPPGKDGSNGAIARADPWRPEHFYSRHATVTHLAGLWQAREPTDAEPGDGEKWNCLVRGVADVKLDESGAMVVRYSDQTTKALGDVRGLPGREWQHKGTYDPKAWYTRADVVVVRGTSYVAVDDSPGDCPGEGWRMVAQAKAGPSGKRGPQGESGARGTPGRSIRWFGEHDTDTKYPDGAVVRAGGDLWVALESTSEPPSPDAIDWDLMLPGGSA